ncbi:transposable element Tcb1 transposase [Trichonephila clavipes]|uniref:Transposable element Tcb1 transposase n=1 Tax=Trichonephila clavipes TaxID=2585209 RepID=A0A8X6SIW5_TRICX|nr:transposable element Tcb1 transposase [Trichonephila clavipes]
MLNSCVMHRHTGPAPFIMVWGGIGYHSGTPLGLATAIFQQDNARPHVARIVQRFFVNHQIELLPWLARFPDLSPIENMWSMVAQRSTHITPLPAHEINLGNVWKLLGLLCPRNTSKTSLNQCRGVWKRRSLTMAGTLATDSGRNHTSQKSINLII